MSGCKYTICSPYDFRSRNITEGWKDDLLQRGVSSGASDPLSFLNWQASSLEEGSQGPVVSTKCVFVVQRQMQRSEWVRIQVLTTDLAWTLSLSLAKELSLEEEEKSFQILQQVLNRCLMWHNYWPSVAVRQRIAPWSHMVLSKSTSYLAFHSRRPTQSCSWYSCVPSSANRDGKTCIRNENNIVRTSTELQHSASVNMGKIFMAGTLDTEAIKNERTI